MDRFIGTAAQRARSGAGRSAEHRAPAGSLPGNRALLGIQPLTLGWGDSPGDVVAAVIPEAPQGDALLYKWQVINETMI